MPRLNLDWLKPPKVPADGVMSLGEHLREFRYRVVVSAITILVGMIGVAFFWQPLLDVLASPLLVAFQVLRETNPKLNMSLTMDNYVAPFFLVLRICLVGGLVVTSPMWLYQAWAYIVPALLAKEKKLALAFIAVATPLFTNVNDGTSEGLSYNDGLAFSSQFHPEAAAGPQDTSFLFDDFVQRMEVFRACR